MRFRIKQGRLQEFTCLSYYAIPKQGRLLPGFAFHIELRHPAVDVAAVAERRWLNATVRALVVGDGGASRLLVLAVEREHERVQHQREDGREHSDEGGEGELGPGVLRQAWRREVVERVREHVHVPGGEDDAGGEGLHDEEEVSVRAERGDRAGEERQADAEEAGREDGGDGDELQTEGSRLVVALALGGG